MKLLGNQGYIQKKPEIIIGMDHNLDLLKSDLHKSTHAFLELMLQNELYPSFTRPSRITNTSATLIDNIFNSEKFHHSFDKSPLEFQSRVLTDDKLCAIKNKLYRVDWIRHLNSAGCNINFNIYSNILNEVMDEVAPLKTVQIFAKR